MQILKILLHEKLLQFNVLVFYLSIKKILIQNNYLVLIKISSFKFFLF